MRHAAKSFHFKILNFYTEKAVDCTLEMCEKWKARVRHSSSGAFSPEEACSLRFLYSPFQVVKCGEAVQDVTEDMMPLAYDIILRVCI